MAKLLHIADLHLGKSLHGVSLLEDQRYILDKILDIAQEHRPQVVLVAGDLYDRSVPPIAAVELLDHFLFRLVSRLNIPTLVIAGNHDSAPRLAFGSRLLNAKGLHLFTQPTLQPESFLLEDEFGSLEIFALPYLKAAQLRELASDPSVRDQQSAFEHQLSRIAAVSRSQRSVLVAHTHLTGGILSDSVRPLSMRDDATVSPHLFDAFSYVALGHLHRAQEINSPRIQYAGSPLKYSASETEDRKSVNLVEINAQGECSVERLPLLPRRDLHRVDGFFEDLMTSTSPLRHHYVVIRLLDQVPVLDAMARLRQVFPYALRVEYTPYRSGDLPLPTPDPRLQDTPTLFAAFFEEITGQTLNSDEEKLVEIIHAQAESTQLPNP